MLIDIILGKCNERFNQHDYNQCQECSYGNFCPQDCEKCLNYIHNHSHAPKDAPDRKYDCVHMADFYTCKYSCRYTSEIMYALELCRDLHTMHELKVLSFGCGPCTDLFAIDALRKSDILIYDDLEYRGVDYSRDVWQYIHKDISDLQRQNMKIRFYYKDACELINSIAAGTWLPNIIVFQYVFSDMAKHTLESDIDNFINVFSEYYNKNIQAQTYIIINDVNLGRGYGGGREYFDRLRGKLQDSLYIKGHFPKDNAKSKYYPRGFPYGKEFLNNKNRFDIDRWRRYSPFDTCASAQMIIKKE